jgi:hypothetical protein
MTSESLQSSGVPSVTYTVYSTVFLLPIPILRLLCVLQTEGENMNVVHELGPRMRALQDCSGGWGKREGGVGFLRPKNPVQRKMALAALCRIYRGRVELSNSTVRCLLRRFLFALLEISQVTHECLISTTFTSGFSRWIDFSISTLKTKFERFTYREIIISKINFWVATILFTKMR